MTTQDDVAAIARRHERHVETPHGRVYVTEIPGGDPPIVLMQDPYLGPSLAAEIAALFPDPSIHLLPGAGHYPQHDQPDAVAELLKEPLTA